MRQIYLWRQLLIAILIFVFQLLIPKLVLSQKVHNLELGIASDNDSYTLRGKDGYYTNGIKIALRWKNKTDTSNKTIRQIEVGQLMYNAKNGSYNKIFELDRPVTAWLYAAYMETHFTKNENVWRWQINAGTIGPPAMGRQLQEGIHATLGMYKPREWQFQLKTAVGVNTSIDWSPNLNLGSENVTLKPMVGATLGMTFTNAHIGGALLLGKFNTNSSSTFWDSRLNTSEKESFFYIYPQLYFKAYDATVEGGLFRKSDDKGDYVGNLNRVLLLPKMGYMYANKNFSLHLGLTFTGRESKTQRENQLYGTIGFGFKL